MADGFRIDAAWLDALDRYVDGLMVDTQEAAKVGISYLTEKVVDQAREHPEWVSMADNIEVWSEDGRFTIGVQNTAFTSEAFALEYGDENRPPSPLFRKARGLVPEAQDRMQRELVARRGPPPVTGMKV